MCTEAKLSLYGYLFTQIILIGNLLEVDQVKRRSNI